MRNQTALEDLNAKITLLIEKYTRIKDENIKLSEELAVARKKIEEQKTVILKLQENDELKTMEIEDIAQKITKLLS